MRQRSLAFLLLATGAPYRAQVPAASTGSAVDFALQPAVPASPAFKLVELSEPSILRPQTDGDPGLVSCADPHASSSAGWTLDPGTHTSRLTSSLTVNAKFPSTTSDSDH